MILSSAETRIRQKIEEAGKPLKEWDVNIYRGILTGYNEAFIIDGATKDELIRRDARSAEIIRPILRGRDIKRYRAEFADNWLINTHNGVRSAGIDRINAEKDYPAVFEYLNQPKFKPTIEIRSDRGFHWTNLRNCAYLNDFGKEKVAWIELTDPAKFTFDNKGFMLNNTVFFMVGDQLKYLLSFLNSTVCEWYFDKIAATSGAGTRRWIKMYIDELRVPMLPTQQRLELSSLVDQILKEDAFKHVSSIKHEINNLIYRDLNLTLDEIRVIESLER